MFFFNGRIRNPNIVPIITQKRTYTHKVGQWGIIATCLSIVIGLILIIIGVISETKKTRFFGIGIIILGVGFSFTTFVCFYAKLNICYRNWAYGPHIASNQIQSYQPVTAGDI